jgi:hypothetical protein
MKTTGLLKLAIASLILNSGIGCSTLPVPIDSLGFATVRATKEKLFEKNDPNHADELLNIRKWNNDAGKIKIYKVNERVSGYAGKVTGGDGHQFYIPDDVPLHDVLEEVL